MFDDRQNTYPVDLDSETFSAKLKQDKNAILIDVRTPVEYEQGHIPDSVLLDIMRPDFITELDKLDRDKNYYLYCRSGNRSFHAGRQMLMLGFKKVFNLEPGIIGWHEPLQKVTD